MEMKSVINEVFEYDIKMLKGLNTASRVKTLNELGKEGWEVITVNQNYGGTEIWLKRKINTVKI